MVAAMIFWVVPLTIVAVVVALIVWINRTTPADYTAIQDGGPVDGHPPAGPRINVLTWNVGYGALGKDADFVVDQGKYFRALPKAQIQTAAHAMAQTLAQSTCDIYCLQETAKPCFTTRRVDVRGILNAALPSYRRVFWTDLRSRFFPPFVRFRHGMSTYMAKQCDGFEVIDLPRGETIFFGILKKHYAGLVTRSRIDGSDRDWVIVNLHLPVFGVGVGVRSAQWARVFEVAQAEFAQGNHVVLAGDWNTLLCATDFPHQTDPSFLSWVASLPPDSVPAGWQIVTDPTVATVRSLHEPYREGHTFTGIIDGYIVSPNVRAVSVKTHDLGFEHSDHNPVEAVFAVKGD